MLESAKNIILPVEVVSRFELGKVISESETDGAAMILVQKFVGHNVNTTCISMAREESIPNTESMEGDISAGGVGTMESFRIIPRGEDLSISKNDFVASDVSLVKIVEWSLGGGSGDKRNEITDRNDLVGVLVVIVALLDIRGEEMVTELVLGHRGWLGNGGRTGRADWCREGWCRDNRRNSSRVGNGIGNGII